MFRIGKVHDSKALRLLTGLTVVALFCIGCGLTLSAVSDDSDAAFEDQFWLEGDTGIMVFEKDGYHATTQGFGFVTPISSGAFNGLMPIC